MKTFTIVIPTRNRIKKLERTLQTIPLLDCMHIHIICDGDSDSYNHFSNYREDVGVTLIPSHNGSVFCRNYIISQEQDGVLYATDDILFSEGSIQKAFETFNRTFQDDDGVVGFKQDRSPQDCPTGVALVGQKFLQRYPEKKLFFPGYFHFSAQEIYRLCCMIQKNVFITSDELRIKHLHPGFIKEEMDQTHVDARKYRNKDLKLAVDRQISRIVWGKKQ